MVGKITLLTLMDRYNDDAKCRDTLARIVNTDPLQYRELVA